MHRPADPGDIRFEVTPLADPELGATHLVLTIDDRGEVIARDITDLPYELVEAAREAQARRAEADRLGVHPLELAFEPFGPEWQREQAERW